MYTVSVQCSLPVSVTVYSLPTKCQDMSGNELSLATFKVTYFANSDHA